MARSMPRKESRESRSAVQSESLADWFGASCWWLGSNRWWSGVVWSSEDTPRGLSTDYRLSRVVHRLNRGDALGPQP
eukprot:5951693-Pyramimonas_sp.AAC.1